MITRPPDGPAPNHGTALARARAVMARDDQRILPAARTALFDHGGTAQRSVVLLHGLTNHPGQYAAFAPQLYARGVNVFVPRMPYHGYADRMTTAIAALTAEDLVASAYEAVDVASGLGREVAVMGLSMGGLLSAYLAQFRQGLALAVPIAPDFGLLNWPRSVTRVVASTVRVLPNLFLWWDPRIKAAQRPATAYPRFSTHALMQTVRIGDDVYHDAATDAPKAPWITTVSNAADPAVNNAATAQTVERWKRHRSSGIEAVTYTDLPQNHDIIDPDNPLARIDLVYPRLLEILTRRV